MIVAFASAKSSPGVTTAVVALASMWPDGREVLLVEADPAGGDIAARLELPSDPGIVSLAAHGRRSIESDDVREHAQVLPGARAASAVLAPTSGEQAAVALMSMRGRLPTALAGLRGVDVLVDCGRLEGTSAAIDLASAADLLVWVTRPDVVEIHHLHARIAAVGRRQASAVLLVGDTPYNAAEVGAALELPVLGAIAVDGRAATALRGDGGGRSLDRSALFRSARAVAEVIVAVPEPTVDVEERSA